ncbi:hypothetical protein, partial [uncultured Selenomonas sp.]|uniref:hypothetical protein n=1 Tax=uncultured Selenomonas sp. TaxID=159275 RepID=UPI0028D2F947
CVKHAASVRPEPGSNSPKKLAFLFAESRIGSFLSLDTILSNRIKKLSIAFTIVVHNRCFIKISLDGHLA